LSTGTIIGSRDTRLQNSFWWIGHLYLPVALLYGLLLYGSDTIWAFTLGVVLYGMSIRQTNAEWRIKTFLYAGFTTLWITILLTMTQFEMDHKLPFAFLITSVIIGLFWYMEKDKWSKRIAYYAVPFSLLGIRAFIALHPYDMMFLVVTLLYAGGLLFVIHRQKWDWINFIPLALI